MDIPKLNLEPPAEVTPTPPQPTVEPALLLADLQLSNQQLRALMEQHNQRLDAVISQLGRLLPRPARRSSARPAKSGSVWCIPCGCEATEGESQCRRCSNPLRSLAQLARDLLSTSLEPAPGGRFETLGWELVGSGPVDCPSCLEPLRCAVKLYQSNGKKQRYWALLCPRCSTVSGVNELRRDQKDELNRWAGSQPMLRAQEPDDGSEPPALSATLQATYEAVREGLAPQEVASSRGLAVATIYGHLASLVQLKCLALEELLSPQLIECIVGAHGRFPRPVDLADLEARLPMPVLRQDVALVAQALQLEMGLGDPVDELSRATVRQTMETAVKAYEGRLTTRDLLGICLGTEGYRTGQFANRALFGSLRGFAQAALSEELRQMAREGGLVLTETKKLSLAEPADD